MARRTVSWLIGGGVALLALLAVVTAVPLRAQPVESQQLDVRATSSSPEAPACATMRLTGTLESQQSTPLVDVWGLSEVEVALIEPVVKVGGEAPCAEDVRISDGQAFVYTPACDSPEWVESEEPIDRISDQQSLCGGNGIGFTATVTDPAVNETTASHSTWRFDLGSSGVIAADSWCLGTEFGVGHFIGNEFSGSTLDVVEGDSCVEIG